MEEKLRLIATFDGWEEFRNMTGSGTHWSKRGYLYTYESVTSLKYHTDWKLLMPVIEKLVRIKVPEFQTEFDTFYLRTFGMMNMEYKYMVRFNCMPLHESEYLIVATFNAVVELIHSINVNDYPKVTVNPNDLPF